MCDFSQFIPDVDPYFIPNAGTYKLIEAVVADKVFFPVYIYGLSGIGKTMNVEQACAANKRPMFRAQITRDTNNEDLIGAYSLEQGNTVWKDGPVLKAYRSGGVLLLDEIDLNPTLMILQGVLENKPLFVTQTGELVKPKQGFTVFATGNTKGDGGDAKYVGTSVLNDAFLERFVTIIEHKLPTIAVEKRIIDRFCKVEGIELDADLYDNFLRWIELVRKSYTDENIESYISSRRIQYILRVYKMTGDFKNSLKIVLARYPQITSDALFKTWNAING